MPLSDAPPPAVVLGHHWLVELHGCSPRTLNAPAVLEVACLDAARAAGATVLGAHFHPFQPQGVSGVVLIAESHLTIHTWPEHRYAAVDLFSCSARIDAAPATELLAARLDAEEVILSARLRRGVISDRKLERFGALDLRADGSSLSWRERFDRGGLLSVGVDLEGVDLEPEAALERLTQVLEEVAGVEVTGPAVVQPSEAVVSALQPLSAGVVALHAVAGHYLVDVHLLTFCEPADLAAALARALGARGHGLRAATRGKRAP